MSLKPLVIRNKFSLCSEILQFVIYQLVPTSTSPPHFTIAECVKQFQCLAVEIWIGLFTARWKRPNQLTIPHKVAGPGIGSKDRFGVCTEEQALKVFPCVRLGAVTSCSKSCRKRWCGILERDPKLKGIMKSR
jgi:hypothetical protein